MFRYENWDLKTHEESKHEGICDHAPDEDHMGSELFIIILLSNSYKCKLWEVWFTDSKEGENEET